MRRRRSSAALPVLATLFVIWIIAISACNHLTAAQVTIRVFSRLVPLSTFKVAFYEKRFAARIYGSSCLTVNQKWQVWWPQVFGELKRKLKFQRTF